MTQDQIIDRIVQQEVLANASMLIHQLAQPDAGEALGVPIDDLLPCLDGPDYNEAPEGYRVVSATAYVNGEEQRGYSYRDNDNELPGEWYTTEREAIEAAWEDSGEEAPRVEALEHWIVSDWLANKLEAAGALIARDILGFNIWGRTETGQSLTMDADLTAVAKDLADG